MSDYSHEMNVIFVPQSTQVEMHIGTELFGDNVVIAERLQTPRQISLIGAVRGATIFDGSADVVMETMVEVLTNEDIEEMMT